MATIEFGVALGDAIEAALPLWLQACVTTRAAQSGLVVDEAVRELAIAAGEAASETVIPELRQLLSSDVDAQWTTPLALIRRAVRYPTEALSALAVPPVERDRFSIEHFPHDVYGLTPANLADLGEQVGEAAIAWGAAKAWEHKQRHQHTASSEQGEGKNDGFTL